MTLEMASLFAGAGISTYGFSKVFSPALAVEERTPEAHSFSLNMPMPIEKCSVFAQAEKGRLYRCDIRDVSFKDVGQLDFMLATPPSTDFSRIKAVKRMGIAGEKGSLMLEAVRAVKEAMPSVVVIEEVEGLLSVNGGNDWMFIVSELKSSGYKLVHYRIFDYRGFGLPQAKKRLIAFFVRGQKPKTDFAVPYDPILLRCPLTPIEAFEGLPLDLLQSKYEEFIESWLNMAKGLEEPFSSLILREMKRLSGDIISDYSLLNSCPKKIVDIALDKHREVLKELGYFGKQVRSSFEAPRCRRTTIEKIARIPPGRNIEVLKGTHVWDSLYLSNIYKRLHPLKPSYVLPANGGGGTYVYHYMPDRCSLTNEERKRLQSVPDDYVLLGKPLEVRRQIADSMPYIVAKKIAEPTASLIP